MNVSDLGVVTYNCWCFNHSMLDVQNLLNDYRIIFVQETSLAKQQLDILYPV